LTYTGLVTVHEFDVPDPDNPGSTKKSGVKGVQADTTDAAFAGADAWFAQVQTPETLGTPAALTMTSNPAANATGVAVGIKPALTFSNAIAEDAVTLIKSDGTLVATTKSYDAAGKVLTITPTVALTSAGVYSIIVAGVKDVYGQALETAAIKFTVA
jgi:methionine-rich copper-binding protein CopC